LQAVDEAGSRLQAQVAARAHFGLGKMEQTEVRVVWGGRHGR
jgi:hypothetical protein